MATGQGDVEKFEIVDKERKRLLAKGMHHIQVTDEIEAKFSSETEYKKYLKWVIDRAIRKPLPRPLAVRIPPAKEIIAIFRRADVRNGNDICRIIGTLNLPGMPYIGLGTMNNVGYRLYTDPELLAPTRDRLHDEPRRLMEESVMGVNLNVIPPIGKRATQEPVLSDDSEALKDKNGFVFCQLGSLQYYDGDTRSASEHLLRKGRWVHTGYAVVAKIDGSTGKLGEIYIMFNFRPVDDDGERAEYWPGGIEYGELPEVDFRFTMAKIADDIQELQHGKDFTLHLGTVRYGNFELVPAVKTRNLRHIVRQYVSSRQHGQQGSSRG
ncbi:hypothetical protein BU26DRAFT_518321 [Trematosphaeria pertusa]|uniref:Uncharacterized protein n=1 Tax=Trematosphaeria pertusa TaxID=390896 RepID=A0A6A6IHA4_9PLEO|nr:uncharacterized protein BU26DRAFT_518321 [Trematosphaeria pertusa]KAF2249766.1 hypothetical protein BU26DRAFT_518321 [Trematosphaeria pertusa]